MYKEFPADFPIKLKNSAVWLEEKVGVKEYGWHYEDVLKVIEYLEKCDTFILGGDVLEIKADGYEYPCDNWYINYDENKTKDENIIASCNKAFNYIKSHQANRLGEYLYVLVYQVNNNASNDNVE
jgi:hypothetical protein